MIHGFTFFFKKEIELDILAHQWQLQPFISHVIKRVLYNSIPCEFLIFLQHDIKIRKKLCYYKHKHSYFTQI